MANKRNGTLYVGVTNNLIRRVYEHKLDKIQGFTQKYGIHSLVYFETTDTVENAMLREKQLKAGSRKKKLELIESENQLWQDFYNDLL